MSYLCKAIGFLKLLFVDELSKERILEESDECSPEFFLVLKAEFLFEKIIIIFFYLFTAYAMNLLYFYSSRIYFFSLISWYFCWNFFYWSVKLFSLLFRFI